MNNKRNESDGSLKNKEELKKLQNHLAFMKKEIKETNGKIKGVKNFFQSNGSQNRKFFFEGLLINEKSLSNGIVSAQKKVQSKFLLLMELLLLPVVFLLLMFSGIDSIFSDFIQEDSFQSKYFIENLRGDTIDTWKSWRLIDSSLNVNIIIPNNIPADRAEVISNAINSMEAIEISSDGKENQGAKYYLGWKGALNDGQSQVVETKYQLPLHFNILSLSGGEGDIVITLSNIKDIDGYTGYTKSIVDGNEILKSFITIYDAENLNDEELATIVRHEFGHALGLGHSTASEDLMAPTIDMTFPLISECNVMAMVELYDGGEGKTTICEK